jgi:phosphoglycerate dehydrogenase-like enzyme
LNIWTNTNTLAGYIDDLKITPDPANADIALLGSKKIELDNFLNLKGIFRVGVGKDNIPEEEAARRGIAVSLPSEATIKVIFDETASFTCATIFHMAYRNVGTLSPWAKAGRKAFSGLNLLVIGKGNIGSRVMRLMQPFLNVKSFDLRENGEYELEGLMREADFVSLHIPLSAQTRNFINSEKLSWMKDHSVLINTSRGPIVAEDDLYREIETGRLSAAFDVYWEEPYAGKLSRFHPESFYMTPHVASTCSTFLEESAKDFRKFMERIRDRK